MKTAEEILFKYTGWLGNAKMVYYDDALKAMEEFASQFKQSSSEGKEGGQWISVKERLPDSKTRVLLFGRFAEHHESQTNTEYTGVYDEVSDMWYCLGHIVVNVTHWQPLPSKPENK